MCAGAHAQGFPAGRTALLESALTDAIGWVAEPGRPGWIPSAGLGLGTPLPLAGLVRGGWSFGDDPRGPAARPFPGITVGAPLVVLDSLRVRGGAGEDPSAFRAGLAEVRPVAVTPDGKARPRSVFGQVNGDFAQNETALYAERADEASAVRIETIAGSRAEVGPYGRAGRHAWGVGLERHVGSQRLGATFRQSATAASLGSGEGEAVRGASGRIDYSIEQGGWRHAVMLSRQWDERESYGGTLDPPSRRDAQENRVTVSSERVGGTERLGALVDWSRAKVARVGGPEFLAIADEVWVGGWWRNARPDRVASVELGGGHQSAVDRLELAPRARVEWIRRSATLGLWAARTLDPAWHDLAPGEHPFLQNTWALGGEAARVWGAARAGLTALAGRTRDRVVLARLPLDEQWLRAGQARDPAAWNFALITARVAGSAGPVTLGLEGSDLVSSRVALQGRVDPAVTGRGWAGWGFRAFTGDLDVNLRAELDAIGPRATDEPAPRALPGFASAGVTARLTLSDLVATVRVRNLENRRRPEVWIDRLTGAPALGTGREMRISVGWKLLN